MAVLTILRQVLLKLLRQGYNPYSDNESLYQKQQEKQSQEESTDKSSPKKTSLIKQQAEDKKPEVVEELKEVLGATLKEAFEFDIMLKAKTLQASSLRSYGSHIRIFKHWLSDDKKNITHISQVDKSTVSAFLLQILSKTSARNRNNYRASLSSFFSTLEEHEFVRENFVKKIKNHKTTATRNKTYTKIQQQEIFDHLEQEDPTLLLFIKFVSFNFLRPIEVCRLKIADINIQNQTLSFKAKNSPLKTKIIPKVLWTDLPDLANHKREDFLFTPNGIGGTWETTADNKRNYFSKRFKKVVKNKFGLGTDYGMYSFRHTYITKLYRELRKTYTPFEAKSNLMQITGHSSMSALEQYLRDIDAELPEDYSQFIKD